MYKLMTIFVVKYITPTKTQISVLNSQFNSDAKNLENLYTKPVVLTFLFCFAPPCCSPSLSLDEELLPSRNK